MGDCQLDSTTCDSADESRVLLCLDQDERTVHSATLPIVKLIKYPFFRCMHGAGFQESRNHGSWSLMIQPLIPLSIGRGRSLAYKYKWSLKIIFEEHPVNDAESFLCVLFVLDFIDGFPEVLRILSSIRDVQLFMDCVSYLLMWCYSMNKVPDDTTLTWVRRVALTLEVSESGDCWEKILQTQTRMIMHVCNQIVFDSDMSLSTNGGPEFLAARLFASSSRGPWSYSIDV